MPSGHAVSPGQGGRRASGPLSLQFPGAVVAGGAAARAAEPGPVAVVRGGRPPRPAGTPVSCRAAAAARRGAEEQNVAEEALQGLLHGPAAGPALRALQNQPPAQAAAAVGLRPERRRGIPEGRE